MATPRLQPVLQPKPQLAPQPATAIRDRRLAYVLARIERDFADPALTVERLAAEVRLSPSQLRRLAQQELGRPLKAYIVEKRLLWAQELLLTTFLSAKEVMAAVGVNDPTDFSRMYMSRFGTKPSEQRTCGKG